MLPIVNIVNILQQHEVLIAEKIERTFRHTTFRNNSNVQSSDSYKFIKGALIRSRPLSINLPQARSKFTLQNCTMTFNTFLNGVGR